MLESAVELLGGLLLSAVMLLIGSCVVGSSIAAIRAVSRCSATGVRASDGGLRFRG